MYTLSFHYIPNPYPTKHLRRDHTVVQATLGSDWWLNYNKTELLSSRRHLNLTKKRIGLLAIGLRPRDNSIQTHTKRACRRQKHVVDWIEYSAHTRDIFLRLSPGSQRRRYYCCCRCRRKEIINDGECAVVHRVCAITMLITNEM